MPTCFSLEGYRHLYYSLMLYLELHSFEAKSLVYLLNTANIDTCREANPNREYRELDMGDFFAELDERASPYQTTVQLYKSMEALSSNIRYSNITEAQRDAVKRLRTLMHLLDDRFYEQYGYEIDDPNTVYSFLRFHLIPA
jgi:hypothetical protein